MIILYSLIAFVLGFTIVERIKRVSFIWQMIHLVLGLTISVLIYLYFPVAVITFYILGVFVNVIFSLLNGDLAN
jgi:hypothetical protein